MAERLLSRRPGMTVAWRFDPADGVYVIEHRQDVRPVLAQNRRDQADMERPGGAFWHAGRIPLSVVYEWRRQGIDVFDRDHWPAVRRKLNDIDYAALRTAGRFRV